MKALKKKWVVGSLVLGLTAGCVTPGKNTAVGAGAGAILGAGAGALIGKGWGGAAIGAAAGAAAGGAVGNYLDKQARELEQVAETERTENGILLKMPSEFLFATDSAQLNQDAVVQVTKVADILVKYPEDRIRVEGHTDNTGPDAYNQELSLKRADAVARVLLARGVKSEQIMTVGFGENQPVADNGSVSGRQSNRRVQLYIDIPQSQQQQVEQKALRNRS